MYGEEQYEIGCNEFQALLGDALDGILEGKQQAAFEAHRRTCALCEPLYVETETGLHWLQALKADEVLPPPMLLQNILRATSAAPVAGARKPWWRRLRELPWLNSVLGTVLQPRFAMAFAMVFFSLSAVLNLTGVRLGHLRANELLHPGTLLQSCQEATGKAVGRVHWYYDNLRWVYELESRLHELRQIATPPERPSQSSDPITEPRQKSEQPERRNERHSPQEERTPTWAGRPAGSGVEVVSIAGIPGSYEYRRCL